MLFISPLEQFEVISLFGLTFLNIDIYLVHSFFLFLVNLSIFLFIFSPFYQKLYILPTTIHQLLLENVYNVVLDLLTSNAGKVNQKFFPIIFNLSFALFFCNIIGMFPFGFTLTSHIILTFFFSFSIFLGINILGVLTHKVKFMGLFLPSGTPFLIMPFLFLIELLSYFSRLFSLAIRLFANMMSGHTLLKILTSFLFSSFSLGGVFLFVNVLPIVILHVIIFMECCIAVLQVYVFVVLSCLYIHDITDVSH